MSVFAYTSLGLAGLMMLTVGGVFLAEILKEPLGRLMAIGCLLYLLVASAAVSLVWLAVKGLTAPG